MRTHLIRTTGILAYLCVRFGVSCTNRSTIYEIIGGELPGGNLDDLICILLK